MATASWIAQRIKTTEYSTAGICRSRVFSQRRLVFASLDASTFLNRYGASAYRAGISCCAPERNSRAVGAVGRHAMTVRGADHGDRRGDRGVGYLLIGQIESLASSRRFASHCDGGVLVGYMFVNVVVASVRRNAVARLITTWAWA